MTTNYAKRNGSLELLIRVTQTLTAYVFLEAQGGSCNVFSVQVATADFVL